MDTVEYEIHQKLQGNAGQITLLAGDAINNVNSVTHYSYSRVYATSFTAPIPEPPPWLQNSCGRGFLSL